MAYRQVGNSAALIVDHETNQIWSWVVAYAGRKDKPFNQVDAVLARRQPVSVLKPFLYTNASTRLDSRATLGRFAAD